MPEPDEQFEGLILAPIEKALLERLRGFEEFCRVACYAITEIRGLPRLVEALRKSEEVIERADSIADIAKREHESGFATLFEFSTVFAWGALETSIRDMTINWLLHVPESRQCDKIRRLKIPFADYEALDPRDRMRFLVGLLENDLGASLKPGIGRFECLFSLVGLGGSVDNNVRRDLLEMAAVRNVIVHNLGVVDDRFSSLCPWYVAGIGDRVKVSKDTYGKYRDAVFAYAIAIVERVEGRLSAAPSPDE